MADSDTYTINVAPLLRVGKITGESLPFRVGFNFTETDTPFDPYEISKVEISDETGVLLETITGADIVNIEEGTFEVEYAPGTETAQTLFDSWYFKVASSRATIKAKLYTEVGLDTVDETQVRLDQDYGGTGALAYELNGEPVEGASIRVAKQLLGEEQIVAITATDSEGHWLVPVYVEPGFTYKVYFQKLEVVGPDVVTLVI